MAALEQALLTWAHLVAAAIWVGGSLFIGIVFSPLLKTMSDSVAERMQIMIRVGRRFNKIAVPSLIILMGTGLYSSHALLARPELLGATRSSGRRRRAGREGRRTLRMETPRLDH